MGRIERLSRLKYVKVGNVYIDLLKRSFSLYRGVTIHRHVIKSGQTPALDCSNVFLGKGITIHPNYKKDKKPREFPLFILSRILQVIRSYPQLPPDCFYYNSASAMNHLFRNDFLAAPCLEFVEIYKHGIDEQSEVWRMIPDKGCSIDIKLGPEVKRETKYTKQTYTYVKKCDR